MYNTFSSIFVIAASDAVPVVSATVTSRHALDRRAIVTTAVAEVQYVQVFLFIACYHRHHNNHAIIIMLTLSCYHHPHHYLAVMIFRSTLHKGSSYVARS